MFVIDTIEVLLQRGPVARMLWIENGTAELVACLTKEAEVRPRGGPDARRVQLRGDREEREPIRIVARDRESQQRQVPGAQRITLPGIL